MLRGDHPGPAPALPHPRLEPDAVGIDEPRHPEPVPVRDTRRPRPRRGVVVGQAPRPPAGPVVVAPAPGRPGQWLERLGGVDGRRRHARTTSGAQDPTTPIRGKTTRPMRRRCPPDPRRHAAPRAAAATERRAPTGPQEPAAQDGRRALRHGADRTCPRPEPGHGGGPAGPRGGPGGGRSGDWDARTYDRIADPMTRWGADVLGRLDLARGRDGPGRRVRAPAGSPRCCSTRLPTGRVVALDAAPAMLAEARRRLARFGDRGASSSRPTSSSSAPGLLGGRDPVDAVLSTATFHWVLDHDRLFANLAAVMRPGGRLVAQCGAAGNIAGLIEAVRATGTRTRRRLVLRHPGGHPGPAGAGRVRATSRCGRTPSPPASSRARSSRPTSRRSASGRTWRTWPRASGALPRRRGRGHGRAGHRLRAPQHRAPAGGALTPAGVRSRWRSARQSAPQRAGQRAA